jgi:AraC-like DNA-binding protein
VADVAHFSTEQIDPKVRDDVWIDMLRPFFATSLLADNKDEGFRGSIATRMIGRIMVGPTTFNRQRYQRDRRLVMQSGLDQYLLQLFITGSLRGDGDGRDMRVELGDICVFDLARPATTEIQPGATVSLVLPRDRVDRAVQGRTLHGMILRSGMPLTRVLSDLVISLSRLDMEVTSDEADAIEETLTRLLVAAAVRQSSAAANPSVLVHLLRERILAFIDANLLERDLGPALLVRHFQISRAHLYRLLAPDVGIAGLIRNRRLDAAYREIASDRKASITEIAFQFGFSKSSHFARAFRERFAVSPTEARADRGFLSHLDDSASELKSHFERIAAPDRRG